MTVEKKPLKISVFGMGYVGCVSAACLADDGHIVTGVDVSQVKLQALSQGRSPISEPGLDELVKNAHDAGRLKVSTDVGSAIGESDLSLICVGTPSTRAGGINLEFVERVCTQIGRALAEREPGHVVVLRSTVLPGTMDQLVRPILAEISGKAEGEHYHTVFNPEFLREGTAIKDYHKPPKIVIGTDSQYAAEILSNIYNHLDAPLIITSISTSEMVKYTDNAWHALKIAFGNEIGAICRQANVDSHAVMDIFIQDRQLNIAPTYLKPGFAFGGSCLPKDLRALTYYARHHDVQLPVIENILSSNNGLIEEVFNRIMASGHRKIGLYGLSFKPKTDDLRESPYVALAERLIGKGLEVRIFDENIQPHLLTGSNKEYIDRHIPHMVDLLVDGFDALDGFAELVVIGHKSEDATEWVNNRDRSILVFDLARLSNLESRDNYQGISW